MPSGESGIRTHAPFRTNGFQDRLVMTTSISLRMCVLCLCQLCCLPDDKSYSNKKNSYCQHIFTQFLFYFFQARKSPFYHAFGLFLFRRNTVFFQKLFLPPPNCYNYSYYFFYHCLSFPARYNSQSVM